MSPALVLVAGIALTISLQGMIRDEVFPTGDNALKALMTRQFARGDLSFDLRLPAEPWVRALWDEGLYPFEEPFVYEHRGLRLVRFPIPFLLLNAPFYRWLGFRGLYIIPLLSTWVLWWWVWRAGRRLGLPPPTVALVLALVVFGSPVALYSAIYWDHTLATALAFAGMAAVLLRSPGSTPSTGAALAAGALVGASAWFREELLLLGGLLVLGGRLARWGRPRWLAPLVVFAGPFSVGAAAAFVIFVAWNLWLYGHPLGIHSVYSLETFSWTAGARMSRALSVQTQRLLGHFSGLLLALPALLPALSRDFAPLRVGAPLVALSGLYSAGVPVLLQTVGGKEWGPRFLLIVMPLLGVVAGLVAQSLSARRRWLLAYLVVAGVLIGYGAHANYLDGARSLGRAYARRLPPVQFVRSDPARYVAVSHQYTSQLMLGPVGTKTFFLAKRARDLRTLARALRRQGEERFLYVCDPPYGCGALGPEVEEHSFVDPEGRSFARIKRVARFERYLVYEVDLGS